MGCNDLKTSILTPVYPCVILVLRHIHSLLEVSHASIRFLLSIWQENPSPFIGFMIFLVSDHCFIHSGYSNYVTEHRIY